MEPYDISSVRLSGGWSGRVLTRFGGGIAGVELPRSLPTAEQWRELLERFLTDPAAMPGYEVLKYSKAGEVARVRFAAAGGPLDAVCKRTHVRGLRRLIPAGVLPSRASADFDRAFDLLGSGLATALPLAWMERRGPTRESRLFSLYVANVVDLDQVMLSLVPGLGGERGRLVKNAIIAAVADLFVSLERSGLHHRDLKASNIMLAGWDGDDPRVVLLDLEGLRSGGPWRARRHLRPLVRLAASLLGHASVTRTDYARFLRAYIARRGMEDKSWRELYSALGRRAVSYLRESRLRKTHKLDGYAG